VNLDDLDVSLDGTGVLGEVHATLTRYVVFPSPEAADAATLFAAATHAVGKLEFASRLVIRSPVKRCGKSRLLDVLGQLVRRTLTTSDISAAALVRSIGADDPPTIMLDEADATFGTALKGDEKAEHLRGILNAGFGRDRPYKRWDITTRQVEDCPTFAMAVLAGIGSMPDTVEDRAVIITLRRKAPAEQVAKYRIRRDKPKVTAVGDRLSAWVTPNADKIGDAQPAMPAGLNDRAEDVWESLVAVADLAGGDWPKRARRAAVLLSAAAEQDAAESIGPRLLADIRELYDGFTVSFMPSRELVNRLLKLDDAPWRDRELTTRALSDELRPYGIRPRPDRAGKVRGYRLEDFADAFARYLQGGPSEPVKASEQRGDLHERPDGSQSSDTSNRQTPANRQALTCELDALTGSDAPPGTEGPEEARRRPGRPGLPESTRRAILTLHARGGLTYAQIAAEAGVSKASVHKVLHAQDPPQPYGGWPAGSVGEEANR
jgi:hypothetical protein